MLTSFEVSAHFESVNVLTSVEVRQLCLRFSRHAPQMPMIRRNRQKKNSSREGGKYLSSDLSSIFIKV